ncbi:MAG: DNA protecting protein DprA [Sphingobacteriales bacterium UTBCD1]|jgi:DNA processing protein|nr:MAG: DNA protecting protein DprA [Sphingobacteriales bacterium UTBCD1]
MNQDLLYQIALTGIPNIGCVQAKILIEYFGEAAVVFKAKESSLKNIEGIGEIRAHSIKSFTDFSNAEKEIRFIEKFRIRSLFITDNDYPQRLLNCYDSPTLLFYKGKANLNHSKIVAVIGTRNHTEYARLLTEKLISGLMEQNVLIVSGLAFGVDAWGHKAAIKNSLSTVGVLAHGLDQIYPAEHSNLAKEMIREGGGLLTEFPSKTKPDKHNFPVRNRIVAGMSDAVVVVETDTKGGSMITAELANGYNKDVFAFPGKTTDSKSAGCNYLIRNNKAILISDAADLIQSMGWEEKKKPSAKKQKELFIELTDEEKKILKILQEKEPVHIDEINFHSGLSSSTVAAAILNLELKNVIKSSPGKMFSLQ